MAFFRQTFEVVPDVPAHIDAQERGYTRSSQGLTEVPDNIQMEPLRLRVLATAGNGKTLVARHFFDRCAARGGRPLLLWFNGINNLGDAMPRLRLPKDGCDDPTHRRRVLVHDEFDGIEKRLKEVWF